MRKQQIGIGIVHCLTKTTTTGYDKVFTSDNEQWSNLIDDTGDVFKYIKLTQSDIIVRMIKFVRDGWYMCSMKPVLGRDGEYRACWIYFPVSLYIDATGIESIINDVEKEIKTNDYNEQKLRNIADRYSQMSERAALYKVPNQQQGFAIRYVDEGYQSLYDIYEKIYQKDFAKYNWVILMPKSSVEVKTQNIDDITSAKLIGSHVISLGAKDDFLPYYNGQEFQKDIRITEDEPLTIEWRKDGYRPIQKKGQKESDFEISRDDIEKIFRIDSIKVTDAETGRSLITNYRSYKFNHGRWSEDHKFVYIKEDELSTVTVKVSVDNYETETIPLNLSSQVVKPIEVRLQPQKHTYVFKIPVGNGGYITTEPYTSKLLLTECPIVGYQCVGKIREGENYVRFVGKKETKVILGPSHPRDDNEGQGDRTYHKPGDGNYPCKPKRKWYKRFIWNAILVICVLFALIIVLGYAGYKLIFGDKKPQTEYVSQTTDYTEDKSTWEAAKAYLDSCENAKQAKWIKSEMEKYDELRGLYEHINNYEFSEIVSILNKHKDDFMEYDAYCRLYDIAIKNENKKGQFSKDGTITFDNYLRKDFASMTNANTETIPDASKDDDSKEQKPQEHHSSSKKGQNNPASNTSKDSNKTDTSNNQDNNI